MRDLPDDFRAPLCNALQFFAERHPLQRATADKMIDFICSTPQCFQRSNPDGHMTGSAWLLNPAGDKALLTLHHKLGRWMQTGGHADGDPDLLRVAQREAQEESGIAAISPISTDIFDIDIHLIPANPARNEPAHFHYDVRYLLRAAHERVTISPESDALAWWDAGDFATRAQELDSATRRMAGRWLN